MPTRRINLLPPEVALRRRARRNAASMVLAGVVAIALLAAVFVAQQVRLSGEQNRLKAQRAENAQLSEEIGRLAEFEALQRELRQKGTVLEALTRDEVRWSVLLADISLVIPTDVWLTSFTGSVSAAADSRGSIQLSGTTFAHIDVARWLTRLAAVRGFLAPYLSLSAKATIGSTPVVNFNSSVQLSEQSLRRNQPGAERRI